MNQDEGIVLVDFYLKQALDTNKYYALHQMKKILKDLAFRRYNHEIRPGMVR